MRYSGVRRIVPWILLGVVVLASGIGAGIGAGFAPPRRSTPFSEHLQLSPIGGLRDYLVLHHRQLAAGASESGTLVLVNRNHVGVAVSQGCGGKPDFGVVLTNSRIHQSVAFAAVKCPSFILTPGTHRYRFPVPATYMECLMPGGSGHGVACISAGGRLEMPPLPPGHYRAQMAAASPIPVARSIPVTVVPA